MVETSDEQLMAIVESIQAPGWMQDCNPFLPELQDEIHADTEHTTGIHIVLLGKAHDRERSLHVKENPIPKLK